MERLTATWVLPIAAKGLRNGSVVRDQGRIVDVGPAPEMARKFPAARETMFSGILLPPLVNAHHHLELSHLKVDAETVQSPGMVDWIKSLLKQREHDTSEVARDDAIHREIKAQYEDGVALLADIGNGIDIHKPSLKGGLPTIISMLEFIAPSKKILSQALHGLDLLASEVRATGHGPTSTPPELLKRIKKRCREHDHLFSLHTAESVDEMVFVSRGTGPYAELIGGRGGDVQLFVFGMDEDMTPVSYLNQLDLLDKRTLLVHCVHLNEQDLRTIGDSGTGICLCPGSNRYLKNGIASVGKILQHGIATGLGTDSSASNPQTSLWREMGIIAEEHSDVTAHEIIAMATVGGAAVLGFASDYGGLVPGSRDVVLHVDTEELCNCDCLEDVERLLISGKRPAVCQLLGTAQ